MAATITIALPNLERNNGLGHKYNTTPSDGSPPPLLPAWLRQLSTFVLCFLPCYFTIYDSTAVRLRNNR